MPTASPAKRIAASDTACSQHDVIIIGGGLAGLCLSLQIKNRLPDLNILVVERRTHPVPEAKHKVGESSVEIAANYFDTVLGLKEHLVTRQLKKFGFRFFFSEGRTDIDQVTEVGASQYLHTPSYQIDRGIFENFLATTATELGVRFIDGAMTRKLDIGSGDDAHEISYTRGADKYTATARWLIDASGRAGMIKRQLGLQQDNGHDANAVWFRIGARITIDDWSTDPQWMDRCTPRARWLSTNHLLGKGYWVWLIPLSSGSHSVGIVADSRIHPSESLDSFDKVLAWLDRYQPRLAIELRKKENLLQDFAFLRNYSYGCKQVFSDDRWALTGEAGAFLDPFYSPGSDFIAIANTYITDLVVKDHLGESIRRSARVYDRYFQTFYDSTLTLFKNQYPIFGDAVVFPIKILWDYTYYWGILCQIFYQRRLTDVRALGAVSAELGICMELNLAMQKFLRNWSLVSGTSNPAAMYDQARIDWFAELNRGLRDDLDDDGFTKRIRESAHCLQTLALEIVESAQADHDELSDEGIWKLLGSGENPKRTSSLEHVVDHDPSPSLLRQGWITSAQ